MNNEIVSNETEKLKNIIEDGDESETEITEFPNRNFCRSISVPIFISHDSFTFKRIKTSTNFLTQSSLGKKLEDHIIKKVKYNNEANNHSDTELDEKKILNEENENQMIKSVSKLMNPEQMKILEEQIKGKELLRNTVNENKKKKARVSLYLFLDDSTFRQKQIKIAESR